jgi:hypothetical protein
MRWEKTPRGESDDSQASRSLSRGSPPARRAESRPVGEEHSQPEATMDRHDNSHAVIIDTIGKLVDHKHGIGGYCLDCRRLFNTSR